MNWTQTDMQQLRTLRDRAAVGFQKTAADYELLRRATIEANWRIAEESSARNQHADCTNKKFQ